MTMKTKILICLAALLGVAATVNRLELPLAKVTVRVLDEQRNPVSGATVRLGFRERLAATKDVFIAGQTNDDGTFTGEGGCDPSGVGLDINKSGFYQSGAPIPKFSKVDPVANHWLPWGETYTTVLRPIVNPIAMYAKTGWCDIPIADQPCGYDLQVGDWVSPHGKGKTADLVLTYSGRYESLDNLDVTVTVRFSNPRDGIQMAQLPADWSYSWFEWPRVAPENGYEPALVSRFRHDSKDAKFEITETENKRYYFRVRTVEENGRIVSALYGKIRGGLTLAPYSRTSCKVHLAYYLSPTSLDRNLEWDTKRNLLTGLKEGEQPREP
jgi:hypothetical protein